MNKYKAFSHKALGAIIAFVLLNLIIWQGIGLKDLINPPTGYSSGDLARLSYDTSINEVKKNEITLDKQHVIYTGNKKAEILTFGDSFSQGGAGGKNPYYQDYIATYNKKDVAHFYNFKNNSMIETIIVLANSGYLDKIKPKYIILESVQRDCIKRFAGFVDFNKTSTDQKIDNFYKKIKESPKNQIKLSFINTANLKYILYNFLYLFDDNALFSKVYKAKLNKNLFTNKDTLLFYKDDIKSIRYVNQDNIKKINNNLNKLSKILNKKGIKLYFMPAVDKYTLYQENIKNNKFMRNTFFELLEKENKNYILINTYNILKDKKDTYYPDDTHWSSKASDKIFSEIQFN